MDNLKYKNKYRVASARHQHWDYGWNAAYFITICTEGRKHYFGEIVNDKMQLSPVGTVANVLWYETLRHAEHVELDAFVVMPNHIHGILILNNPNDNTATMLTSEQLTIGQQRFQNQGKNTVSSIIGGYKSAVTKYARRLGFEYAWQDRFHDHIIRNDASFLRIAAYIENNPVNWKEDKFHN
jgi:REP element-mobilizing transposase RayT